MEVHLFAGAAFFTVPKGMPGISEQPSEMHKIFTTSCHSCYSIAGLDVRLASYTQEVTPCVSTQVKQATPYLRTG